MGLWSMHKKAIKEFTLRSHDKKLISLLLLAVVLLRITPGDLVLSIIRSPVFHQLVALNPFALRMALYGNKPEYVLYCYGMTTVLVPYFFYVLINSPAVRVGVASRLGDGGRSALVISAFGCFVFIVFVFYIGAFTTLGPSSRINFFVFYSKSGIALMSVRFSFFLVVMFVYLILFINEFYKSGGKP